MLSTQCYNMSNIIVCWVCGRISSQFLQPFNDIIAIDHRRPNHNSSFTLYKSSSGTYIKESQVTERTRYNNHQVIELAYSSFDFGRITHCNAKIANRWLHYAHAGSTCAQVTPQIERSSPGPSCKKFFADLLEGLVFVRITEETSYILHSGIIQAPPCNSTNQRVAVDPRRTVPKLMQVKPQCICR